MRKIGIIAIFLIIVIVFMQQIGVIGSEGNSFRDDPDRDIRIERDVIMYLREIYKLQELFKSQKVKDQNRNGIGEYGSNDELIKYAKEEKIRRRLFSEEKGNLHDCFEHSFRVFIPPTVEEQEQYWLGLAIQPVWHEELKWVRSYFVDNKRDIIFYAENDSLKKLNLSAEDRCDPWSLMRIFWGEPFKSPIDTSIWKILDTSELTSRITRREKFWLFPKSQDENKEPDKAK